VEAVVSTVGKMVTSLVNVQNPRRMGPVVAAVITVENLVTSAESVPRVDLVEDVVVEEAGVVVDEEAHGVVVVAAVAVGNVDRMDISLASAPTRFILPPPFFISFYLYSPLLQVSCNHLV